MIVVHGEVVTGVEFETVTVGILLPERAFQHWADGGWALEAGTFALAAGSSSASLPLTAGVTLK